MNTSKLKRFSLFSVILVVAFCCVLFSYLRVFRLQTIGEKRWIKLCEESAQTPTSLRRNVDHLLRLQELGILLIPSKKDLSAGFCSFERTYSAELQAMEPAEFLQSVDQFEYMMDVLALGEVKKNRPLFILYFKSRLRPVALDVVQNAVDSIELELAESTVIDSPADSNARVNLMIDGIAEIKSRFEPTAIFEGESLFQDLKWQETVMPTFLKIIRNDMRVVSSCEMGVSVSPGESHSVGESVSPGESFTEPYRKRLRTCKELCGLSASFDELWQ